MSKKEKIIWAGVLAIGFGSLLGLALNQILNAPDRINYSEPKPTATGQDSPKADIVITPVDFGTSCEPGHFYCQWGLDEQWGLPTQATSQAVGDLMLDLNELSLDAESWGNQRNSLDNYPCDGLGFYIETAALPEIRYIKETGINLTARMASIEFSEAETAAIARINGFISEQLKLGEQAITHKANGCSFDTDRII